MKNIILTLVLYVARNMMRLIYFFIKLTTKTTNKITMLSRQSDNINIDFNLLKETLKQETDMKINVLCKKIPNGLFGKFKYCFYIIKCMYHIATSKVCIIDGYNIAVSALKHKKSLKIIQIWHAMGAIKKFGYQVLDKEEGNGRTVAKIMKMHANYTCITCTSEATRKIYSESFNTDMNKIQILGMPRIDYILGKDNQIDNKIKELIKDYPYLKEKKNILYVPTFRKNENIDISKIIRAIDKNNYNLIIKLHPLDKTEVNVKYTIDKKYNTLDLIKIADYIITDYSAVAFEGAVLKKPIFFYLYDINKYSENRGLNINLKEEMRNSTYTDIKDIISIIKNDSYDYKELERFRGKYVETVDTENTKRIVDYILNIINDKK